MTRTLLDYYRFPPDLLASISPCPDLCARDSGFFQFENEICYGRCSRGVATSVLEARQFDASCDIGGDGRRIQLPFSATEAVANLRLERYRRNMLPVGSVFGSSEATIKFYYHIRGCLPVSVRRKLQAAYFRNWEKLPFPAWPVDVTVDILHEKLLRLLMQASGKKEVPFIWFWPEGAPSCLILTHDVETSAGRDFTSGLMDMDDSFGFKASFQVIPEQRYDVPDDYVREIRSRGFEFNIHDLNHDGRLYWSRRDFLRRAAAINGYVRRYGVRGFRAGSLYRNQDWYDAFEFSYDMSVPNVAHLEAMRGGCCTVMPYFVGNVLELPVTTAQDFSLFHILHDYSIDLWARQLALVGGRNGLMSIITHPDYLIEQRARNVYECLLDHLRTRVARERIWAALPRDVDAWWRARAQMKLIPRGNGWEIVGPEKERARLAYAIVEDDQVVYRHAGSSCQVAVGDITAGLV